MLQRRRYEIYITQVERGVRENPEINKQIRKNRERES